ncbi:MAG TPA: ATP-binding protein [Polyangiaceae bacterium]|nr:ATP-binding protein [Polyangiaceae bacterium]
MPKNLDDTEAPPSVQASGSPRPPTRQRRGVWVVDDSPLQLEACRAALVSHFEVQVFTSGNAALEQIGAGVLPEVMVLDWHMPDLSGVEVCRFIRGQYDQASLPVLILTASGKDDNLVEALAAGANDFVQKPVSDVEVQARVSGLVRMAAAHAQLLEVQRTLRVEAEFRERFMGMLAHDLRQPLNTIYLASQTLGILAGEASKVVSSVGMQQRAVARMKRMIDELLDFTRSRPETGMPIQRQQADLAQIAQATLDEIRPACPEQVLMLHAEQPCVGWWDPDRLAQVCSNLINNAIEHGGTNAPIDVRVRCSAGVGELTVSNQGAIIPESVLATLFEAFRRGKSVRPSSGGVGLGLYIVDQIVRAHGGSVAADSNEAGTSFHVRLPLHP